MNVELNWSDRRRRRRRKQQGARFRNQHDTTRVELFLVLVSSLDHSAMTSNELLLPS